MEHESPSAIAEANSTAISINVKFSGKSIPISVPSDLSVKALKSLLQPLTNVLPRGQKLISKGKVLADEMTLKALEVTNGAKIMLMASQGLHQGEGPILREARPLTKSRNALPHNANKMDNEKQCVTVDKRRLEIWKTTGVIALSDCNLKAIPNEVWSCDSSARVLDFSNNSIKHVPSKVCCLSSAQKLFLNVNEISDECISWDGLAFLKHLTVLSLSHNLLSTLPSALGRLTSLKQLHVTNNKLTSLPEEIGLMTRLEVLKASNNRISTISSRIGECSSLTEIDLSSNLLAELPETLGCLLNLKALHLSHNGISSLPCTLFKKCIQLCTLDLHNTEITMDLLRQYEGWEDFDERRRLKHQKQLDFRVVGSAEFDEGADKN